MKLEIYPALEIAPEPVRVRLVDGYDGGVKVVVVNAAGEPLVNSNLVSFRSDGRIERHHGVNPDLGFQRDEMGRIRES